MGEMFVVGASVAILREGRLLLLRRGPEERNFVGCWEMPGGAVDPGEPLRTAARREVKEEAGLRVSLGEPFHFHEGRLRSGARLLVVYFRGTARGEPRAGDGMDAHRWVTLAEARRLEMTAGERAAVRAAFGGA